MKSIRIPSSASYKDTRNELLRILKNLKMIQPKLNLIHTPIQMKEIKGRQDEDLFIDFISIGEKKAKKKLILSSGVHGVEGFAGAIVQFGLLESLISGKIELPENTQLLLIFSINPYGMSWSKRTDQENIDINRNFVDFTVNTPENKLYKKTSKFLNETINPLRNPLGTFYFLIIISFLLISSLLSIKKFKPFIKKIFSGGQFEIPKGIFFGGLAPSQSRKILTHFFSNNPLGTNFTHCIWLDIHTGLGKRGELVPLLCPIENDENKMLENINDILKGAFQDPIQEKNVTQNTGKVVPWFLKILKKNATECSFIGLTIEFGVCSEFKTIHSIRKQNIEMDKNNNWNNSIGRKVMKENFNTFFSTEDDWINTVSKRSLELISATLKDYASK